MSKWILLKNRSGMSIEIPIKKSELLDANYTIHKNGELEINLNKINVFVTLYDYISWNSYLEYIILGYKVFELSDEEYRYLRMRMI